MSAPFDLPRTGLSSAAQVRERLGAGTVTTRRELLPRVLHSVCRWRHGDGGGLECQRHVAAGPLWHVPTPALFAGWAREMGLGVDPSDQYAPHLMAAADVAEAVTAEVLELARAGLAPPSRTMTTLSPAAALARQLAERRELITDDSGRLYWRLHVVDPVRGGLGRGMTPPDPAGGRAMAGVLGLRRGDPLADAEEVTPSVVERAVTSSGYLGPHAQRPAWADVVAELRALRGLGEHGAATRWLRSRAGRP